MQETDTFRRPLLTGGDTETLNRERVLYLVTSGAPAPEGVPELVTLCHQSGWRVLIFATPYGARFLDLAAVEQLTGQPVRTDYRMPGESSTLPPADAVLACPLTFNSTNKFAHGHADNVAVSLLCETRRLGCAHGRSAPLQAPVRNSPRLLSEPDHLARHERDHPLRSGSAL